MDDSCFKGFSRKLYLTVSLFERSVKSKFRHLNKTCVLYIVTAQWAKERTRRSQSKTMADVQLENCKTSAFTRLNNILVVSER